MKRSSELKRSWWRKKTASSSLRRSWMKRGAKSLRRTPMKKVNPARVAKKLKAYSARLRRKDWQELRRLAFERDAGLCQCPPCIRGRHFGVPSAFEPIPIWFTKDGKIHGFDTHHATYARFGREALEDVLTMAPKHHRELEAEKGYRRQWLRGSA